MQIRLWPALAALAGLALLAAGCGGGGGSSSSSTGSTVAKKQGGTAHFNLANDTDFTDPALAYYTVSWQMEYATCAKLLNYPDRAGAAGSQLVPEVASAMPRISADGKTYTFKVRKGFKFSPPSNQPVTAKNFEYAIERVQNKKMQSPGAQFVSDVKSVAANGDTLTITLTKKAPDFLARIAMPFFCAIPTDTPIDSRGVNTIASAGPYYVAERTPNKRIVLKRNPNYHGNRPHNLERIVYTVGVSPEATVLQVQKGEADYAVDGIPPAQQSQMGKKFGPESQAAKDGKQQYFVNPTLSFRYLALNTTRPLFEDVNMRKAVNYAIDRNALLTQRGAFAGTTTDQYLPPGVPGYKDADIYPLNRPDVKKAKQLAGNGFKGTAVMYTCNESPCPEQAAVVQANLKQIGIDVEVKQFARAVQFSKEGTRGEPFDIAFEGWVADYADPYDFINVLMYGKAIQAANNVNFSYFNDPTFNKRMEEAAGLAGKDRFKAYGELDVDLVRNASPLAAWDNDNDRDFFSARLGCQLHHPVYGMDITALCMRG